MRASNEKTLHNLRSVQLKIEAYYRSGLSTPEQGPILQSILAEIHPRVEAARIAVTKERVAAQLHYLTGRSRLAPKRRRWRQRRIIL